MVRQWDSEIVGQWDRGTGEWSGCPLSAYRWRLTAVNGAPFPPFTVILSASEGSR